jgi:tetratricopeptide (TPR) repeat protein
VTSRRIEKILILPFALLDEGLTRNAGYLGRQLAIAVRNVFSELAPDVVHVTPMVTETEEGRAWVVHETPLTDEEARRIARGKSFPAVARGSLRADEEHPDRLALDISILRCSDGALLGRRRARGRLMDLVVSAANLLARLGIAHPEAVGDCARPATENEEAYAAYLLGLDVILAMKTEGIELPEPNRALDPFQMALERDPAFQPALDAGLGAALSLLELDLPDLASAGAAAAHRLALWGVKRPEDPRIPLVRSEILAKLERFDEALAVTREAVAGPAESSSVLWQRKSAFEARLGRPGEALASLDRARALEDGPDLILRSSELALSLGDARRAREEMLGLVEQHPGRRDWRLRLAVIERVAGLESEAWERLAGLLDGEAPALASELAAIARFLERGPVPDSFRDRLRRWRPRGTLGAPARLELGRALRRAGALLEARLCLRGVKLRQLDAESGLLLMRERLTLWRPDFEEEFLRLSSLVASGGETELDDAALAFLRELGEREPLFWPGRFLFALGLARSGELEIAIGELDGVIELQPSNDLAWFSKGLQLRKLKRLPEARASIEKALDLNGEERDYHAQLALVAAELDDHPRAERHLEQACALQPDHPENSRLRALIKRSPGT